MDLERVIFDSRVKASAMRIWRMQACRYRIILVLWAFYIFLIAYFDQAAVVNYMIGFCVCYMFMGASKNKDQIMARVVWPRWRRLAEYDVSIE